MDEAPDASGELHPSDESGELQPTDGGGEPEEPERGGELEEAAVDGDAHLLASALEAVCFALCRPLRIAEAAAILDRRAAEVKAAAALLAERLHGTGLMLQRHHDELQLVTRPAVAWAVQRALNPERPARLSRAAMETLAIVAYRQPATRTAIEAIRGVSCDAVLEGLERRGLITEVGRQESPGHPRLFGTTLHFLRILGLESIDDLPPLPERAPDVPANGVAVGGATAAGEASGTPGERTPGPTAELEHAGLPPDAAGDSTGTAPGERPDAEGDGGSADVEGGGATAEAEGDGAAAAVPE